MNFEKAALSPDYDKDTPLMDKDIAAEHAQGFEPQSESKPREVDMEVFAEKKNVTEDSSFELTGDGGFAQTTEKVFGGEIDKTSPESVETLNKETAQQEKSDTQDTLIKPGVTTEGVTEVPQGVDSRELFDSEDHREVFAQSAAKDLGGGMQVMTEGVNFEANQAPGSEVSETQPTPEVWKPKPESKRKFATSLEREVSREEVEEHEVQTDRVTDNIDSFRTKVGNREDLTETFTGNQSIPLSSFEASESVPPPLQTFETPEDAPTEQAPGVQENGESNREDVEKTIGVRLGLLNVALAERVQDLSKKNQFLIKNIAESPLLSKLVLESSPGIMKEMKKKVDKSDTGWRKKTKNFMKMITGGVTRTREDFVAKYQDVIEGTKNLRAASIEKKMKRLVEKHEGRNKVRSKYYEKVASRRNLSEEDLQKQAVVVSKRNTAVEYLEEIRKNNA